MVEGNKQHGFKELSRAEEAETSYPTSASITTTTSTSINTSTATSIDTTTATSIDRTTSTSTNGTTPTSIDGTTSKSIAHIIPASIDGDSCFRSTPLEIHGRSSCSQDIADSTHKSTDVSCCSLSPDVEREITMEVLELEEFLELEDGEKLGDLDLSREVTMEDFLELEEWLEDMDQNSKKKLDDDQHTSRGDLETSPNASIDRHQHDEIDQQPPHIIDRHPPEIVDRHPLLEELPGYMVELEQVEERMYMSKASHPAVHEHQRPQLCAEEAVGFHKKVKMIHDPVKIVVPCAVFEVEFSIPPDKVVHLSSYVEVLDDHQHVEASQRVLRSRDEVDKGPTEATSIDTDRIPSNDTNKPVSINTTISQSKDTGRIRAEGVRCVWKYF
ncbi:hypothetical protein IGI04_014567 [Brassica rapa subsp. trilocularis]|uniref:Uncharacterized protein n=1 Tax=Brassica rapa subsp. trilocularis TaxID=1813537 RepID=A0ABQ7MML0_BRACM|nr:hypothetical protein IGI04_014567 [Brassica rapa subsp. trilocularis]